MDPMVPDPSIRSTKARDRSSSGIACAIKIPRPEDFEDPFLQRLKYLVGSEKLHTLIVGNRSYEEQGRESNYGPHDKGKPGMTGLPTGGSEAKEATPDVAIRELFRESGHRVIRIIRPLYEFTALRKIYGSDPPAFHPHYPYLVATETDCLDNIIEKNEIKWAKWATFCEIIERLKLGSGPSRSRRQSGSYRDRRVNPDAFYFSHAQDFLIPFYFMVYFTKPKQIAAEGNRYYREWLTVYQPYIKAEIDEHAEDLVTLRLVPSKYHLIDKKNELLEEPAELGDLPDLNDEDGQADTAQTS